jgi:peptide/nickel transport system substrate-binding protein
MKRALLAAIAISLVAFLAACAGSDSSPTGTGAATGGDAAQADEGTPSEGGILRFGTTSGPDSLNPFVAYSAISYVFFTEIYPTLVQYDQNFEIIGDWAESWDVSEDGKVWTFNVLPGEWSDGTPLTAKDAAYTGNLIIQYADGPTANLAPFLTHAEKVEAPDDSTVVITYSRPVANVLPQLQQFFVMPQHVLEPVVGDAAAELKKWAPAKSLPMIGAGPFFIEKYDKNGTTILAKNPGYYGETKPYVDAVGITVYQNSDAMLAAFDNGQLDTIDSVPATLAKKYADDPKIQVEIGESTFMHDIGFNSNPDKPKRRELLDLEVRKALAHGVDRQRIIDTVFNGYGKPAGSMLTTLSGDLLNPNVEPEAFDLDLGNQILDDAGYAKGADGIRVTPDGEKMEYDVITPDSVEGLDRQFEIIQEDWGKLGVKITQKKMDGTAAFEAITAPDSKYEDFDIMMWNWVGYIDPDFMLSVVTCDQWGGWSDTGYCNAEYDELYKAQGLAVDPDERREIVWKMQDIQYRDKPYIQVVQLETITAYTDEWSGLTDPFLQGISKIPWNAIYKKQ